MRKQAGSFPVTKLSLLKACAAAGDWRGAVSIAAKFHDLGPHKAAIMKAHEAYTRPEFQRQIGRDPEALIYLGIQALRDRYHV